MTVMSREFRLEAVRLVYRALGIGAYTVAALTGAEYPKLLGLRAAAERALVRGDLDEADRRARELLELAERYHSDWYYGNALHYAHLVLGRTAAARHDLARARAHLLDAAGTPGSPQLNSFGPNMELAPTLLQAASATPCWSTWRAVAVSGPIRPSIAGSPISRRGASLTSAPISSTDGPAAGVSWPPDPRL
jgi:hypothetical protein